jgi:hypothetical protein
MLNKIQKEGKYEVLRKCSFNSQCPSLLTVRVRQSCDAETLKASSDGGGCGNKNRKRGFGGTYGGF